MTERVRVAHLVTKLELGGAQQNTLYTVAHLDRTRFHPILIAGSGGLLDREARALVDVEVHHVPTLVRQIRPWRDLRALVALTKLLRELRPAIVQTHSSKAGILGRVAARLAGVPIILHSIHGFGITPDQPWPLRALLLALERWVGRFTTKFFAVSEANRKSGLAWKLFPPDRCIVIRSGIDLDAFRGATVDRPAARRALGLDPERPLVGMIAPMKPQKAPLDFVRLAVLVHRNNPEARFVFAGDGDLRGAMEAEIQRHGLSRVLRLVGWRRDIPELLRCLDVLVLTSRWEGLPRVYVEALASGVPVVGTDVDGAAEVIRDGVNGHLVPPGSVPTMAEKVSYLLAHPDEARRMGEQGLAHPDEFDIRAMVRRQEDEYDRLAASLGEKKSLSAEAGYGTSTKH